MTTEPLLTTAVLAAIAARLPRLQCRRPIKVVVCLLAGVLAGAPLTGCRTRDAGAPNDARLRIGVGVGSGRSRGLDILRDRFIAEPLISLGQDGKPTPGLAKDWQWEDSGRTLKVNLRPGVTFHDGRPVTASVVASILRKAIAKAIAEGGPPAGLEYLKNIDPSNDLTLLIRLSRPDSFLVAALVDISIVDEQNKSIGTGAFKLASQDPIRMERYSAYYRGEPGLKTIEILPYDTQRRAWAAMLRAEVDMLQEVGRESAEFLEGSSAVRTSSVLRTMYIPLVFNIRHPVLGKVEVRRALNEAVNREAIVKDALLGHGQVAADPIWPAHWAYSAAAKRYVHDPEAARGHLDAAGFPIRQTRSPDHMPSRFRFTCLFWSEQPQYERIAMLLQRQLAEVGVDMDIEPATQAALLERTGRGEYDAYLFQIFGGRSFDMTYGFWHSRTPTFKPAHETGYAAADDILERIRGGELSDAGMRAAVADLQQRFFDDPPAIFLARPEATRAVNARFDLGDDPDVFANVWKWRRSQDARAAR